MAKNGTYFHFKHFSVRHDKASMKVGTDGVLLGAWVNINDATTVLDIGTGTGVIALMLAQRTEKHVTIDGVEIEEQDAQQAEENIMASPWAEKIKIHHGSIQSFAREKQYDLIVSNPPYFNNSYEPPDKKRLQTRHTISLSYQELLKSVQSLLKPTGTFNVILPYNEGLAFIALAKEYDLQCSRQWSFRGRKEKPIERWLLEFSYSNEGCDKGEIVLYRSGEEWSDDYKNLTKEFYLKL